MAEALGRLPKERRDELRARLTAEIPRWYSPWAHLGFPSLVGLGVMVAALASLRDVRAWQLLLVPLGLVLMNASEWRIHRDLLHRRTPPLGILYDRHTPQHHMIFVTDDMAIRSAREFRLVLIPFYGILAAGVAALPIPLVLWLALGQWNLALLFMATVLGYVVAYEWLHLAYHAPAESWVGRNALVRLLHRHHAVHHSPELMQKWNFNVTVPLWDVVRGTVYRGEL
jgi:hypothetical protein